MRVRVTPLFDLELPHGRCVGLSVAAGPLDEGALRPEEIAMAAGWSEARRRSFVAGRTALRMALDRAGIDAPAILADDRGAPRLPAGVAGSISHKESVAVALVAQETVARIGVDVEPDEPIRVDIARRVLTPEELVEIEPLVDPERGRAVRLRFSAKEAVYKAIDPFVRRYVDFHEVSLRMVAEEGRAEVQAHLARGEGPFDIDVRWWRRDGVILTSARARPTDASPRSAPDSGASSRGASAE
jgi:enterobactin synthetase component D